MNELGKFGLDIHISIRTIYTVIKFKIVQYYTRPLVYDQILM